MPDEPAHYRVIVSPQAFDDLNGILSYIATDSPKNAARMIDRLWKANSKPGPIAVSSQGLSPPTEDRVGHSLDAGQAVRDLLSRRREIEDGPGADSQAWFSKAAA